MCLRYLEAFTMCSGNSVTSSRGSLADAEQRRELLHLIVSQFPERRKMAWQLVKGAGLSCKEAARVMQTSEGNIRAHVRDGLIICRRFIQPKGDSHEE